MIVTWFVFGAQVPETYIAEGTIESPMAYSLHSLRMATLEPKGVCHTTGPMHACFKLNCRSSHTHKSSQPAPMRISPIITAFGK